jgi:hypothetical protein
LEKLDSLSSIYNFRRRKTLCKRGGGRRHLILVLKGMKMSFQSSMFIPLAVRTFLQRIAMTENLSCRVLY